MTVVEFLDNIVPNVDLEVAKHFTEIFKSKALTLCLEQKLSKST